MVWRSPGSSVLNEAGIVTQFNSQLEYLGTYSHKTTMAMFFLVVTKEDFIFCSTCENVPFMHFGHGGPQNMVRNMVFLMHDCCMWPTRHTGCPVTHQNVSRLKARRSEI